LPTEKAKQVKSFRFSERKIKLLEAMTAVLSRNDGTTYSQAQVLERALQCLWEKEFDTEDNSWESERVESGAEANDELKLRRLERERDN
jgi:hypothetical protein